VGHTEAEQRCLEEVAYHFQGVTCVNVSIH
jgi:hypothetical protein